MAEQPKYGKRISGEEYDRRVVALHSQGDDKPGTVPGDLRRQELNITIDHRLGVDFPPERRQQLWDVMEHVERRRLRLGLAHILRSMTTKRRTEFPGGRLAGYLVDEFAKVLDEEDVRRFFDDAI